MEFPEIETQLVWGGTAIHDIRSKYLLAAPCRVSRVLEGEEEIIIPTKEGNILIKTISLPGHYVDQIGFLLTDTDGKKVCFAGDVLSGRNSIKKHWIQYLLDETKAKAHETGYVTTLFGRRRNIQDLAVIHNRCVLGDDVSVGHGAIVHGATIGDRVIVGMGAVVLDGAKIGSDCIIGAGAVVTGKMDAPDGSMLIGSPAKVTRALTDKEKAYILANGAEYLEKSAEYRKTMET